MTVIPAAIDALLEACRTAPALHGVQVFDGADVVAAAPVYVAIGLDAEDSFPGDGVSAQAGLAGPRRQDVASIACLTWASSGNTPIKPVRDKADELFGAVRDLIQADTRLGGAVTFAEVITYAYRPFRSTKGAAAQVEFSVQVTAL